MVGKPVGSSLALTQIATPSGNPAAGSSLLYVKSDGKVYTKNSAGVEVLAGPLSKTDIGLGNVPNVDMTNVSNAVSGTLPAPRHGSGTADSTTFLRGDLVWAAPPGGAPSGAAGGSLAGTYPNPTLAAGAVNSTEINAAIKDAAAGTASLRTLGTGGAQAAAGNHTHTPAALGAVDKAGDTMTGPLEAPSMAMTPTVGTAKGRFGGLSGVEAWTGMFLNATYVAGNGWLLDDTTKPGWFFKLDSRTASSEFAVYRIPAGAGYHTDEALMFKVDANALMTVANRVTGVANATGSTDALPKGQADGLYATIANLAAKAPLASPAFTTSATLDGVALVKTNDSRMSDARTPTGHSHAISDLPVATSGTSNTTQVVRADDLRLSNARTPVTHYHSSSDITDFASAVDARADARIAVKMRYGTTVVNLDAAGSATISHGYAVATPSVVIVSMGSHTAQTNVVVAATADYTTTTFKVYVHDQNGAAVVSTARTIAWVAYL